MKRSGRCPKVERTSGGDPPGRVPEHGERREVRRGRPVLCPGAKVRGIGRAEGLLSQSLRVADLRSLRAMSKFRPNADRLEQLAEGGDVS